MERQPRYLKMTAKGQVTIPASIREKLNLTEKNYLTATLEHNRIILQPVRTQTGKDLVVQYARESIGTKKREIENARQILSQIPRSLSEQVSKERDEDR